jgi:hypothetical protein
MLAPPHLLLALSVLLPQVVPYLLLVVLVLALLVFFLDRLPCCPVLGPDLPPS